MEGEGDVCVCDFVHIKRNGSDGTAYPLTKKSELVLGKDDSCDFKVQVPSACARHAKLRVDNRGKVFVTSLVPTVPVSLNGADVLKETPIADKSIISVGSCNFRFIYCEKFATSPLLEVNKPNTKSKPRRKSMGETLKPKDKENVLTRKTRKSLPCPLASVQKPHTPPALNQSAEIKTDRPLTPVATPGSKKKGRVPTPTVARVPRSSTSRSSCSSLSSSLYSIAEEVTPTPTPTNTPKSDLVVTKKAKRSDTPTHQRSRSSHSSSSMSTSLISIVEEDESLASPPVISDSHVDSTGPCLTTAANATYKWLTSTNPKKPPSRRSVSFGPALSPEVFNKNMPPSTPIKPGRAPGGLRRSLPARPETLGLVAETEEEEEEEEGEGEKFMGYSMTGFEEDSSEEEVVEELEEEVDEEEDEEEQDDEPTPCASPAQQPITPPTQSLRRKLATPIRKQIIERPRLRRTRRALPTPLRCAIKEGTTLRKMYRSLPTPLRRGIQARPNLHKTRKALKTPVRKEIESRPQLRKTKNSLPTPLQQDIETKVTLRKTKKSLPTPLRKEISDHPPLRQIRGKALATPVRKEIESRPALRKTMKSMPTPLRAQIEAGSSLRKTTRSLATPLRKEIEARPELRKTKRSMPTPVRQGIESLPTLRKTKNSLPTPIREEICNKPQLRKTKKSLPTPIREEIRNKPPLRKTKKNLPTPIREEICNKPQLRKTKKSLPTPVRVAIQSQPSLRKTKRKLPTPLSEAIKDRPALRSTKKSLPADLLQELQSQPRLRKTKPTLPTPLREEIKKGVSLRSHKIKEPRNKRVYADTVASCETPVPLPPAKKRRIANTPHQPSTPGNITTPQPHVKPTKRGYATTVCAMETPVPVPPAKKIKMSNTPAASTSKPYNFGAYIQPRIRASPIVDLTGLSRIFKSPRTQNSADPEEMFEVRLFGESHEVNFASPLATSKKSTSRPSSAQGVLQSCLKNTSKPLFTIGVPDPPQTKRGRNNRHTRRTPSDGSTVRVTRSRSAKQGSAPELCSDPPTTRRRSRRTATNSVDKENMAPAPVVAQPTRSRRSIVKIDDTTLETKSIVSAPAVRRSSRLNQRLPSPVEEIVKPPTKRGLRSMSIKEEGTASASAEQVTRRNARVAKRSSRQDVSELELPMRHSRRLAGIPAEQKTELTTSRKTRPTIVDAVPMEILPTKKARSTLKQKDVGEATAAPTTNKKRNSSKSVPLRRSSRLRK